MLDRHVEVRHHARALPLGDEPLGDVGRMQVHRPDPRHRRAGERQQQVADVAVAGEIASVGERILRDQDGLLDPAPREPVDLRHDVGERPAPMLAAELGDRAERATHIAALGDLHVRVGHPAGEQPRGLRVVQIAGGRRAHPGLAPVGLVHEIHDAVQLRGPEDGVDLGNLGLDLAAVPLGQTARHDESPRPPPLLELGQLEDRVHRFLAGPVDERAGIDHQAVGALGGFHDLMPRLGEHAQHQLGVHLVLGAAEGREMDFHDGRL